MVTKVDPKHVVHIDPQGHMGLHLFEFLLGEEKFLQKLGLCSSLWSGFEMVLLLGGVPQFLPSELASLRFVGLDHD